MELIYLGRDITFVKVTEEGLISKSTAYRERCLDVLETIYVNLVGKEFPFYMMTDDEYYGNDVEYEFKDDEMISKLFNKYNELDIDIDQMIQDVNDISTDQINEYIIKNKDNLNDPIVCDVDDDDVSNDIISCKNTSIELLNIIKNGSLFMLHVG